MIKIVPALLLSFILLGAGCANTTTETPYTPPTTKDADVTSNTTEPAEETTVDKGLTLTADARGTQSVYFEWDVPADTEYDNYILIRSEDAEPMHDEVNYWFRQHYTRRAVSWLDQPAGTWNFRICGVLNDECAVYSNTVEVVVR